MLDTICCRLKTAISRARAFKLLKDANLAIGHGRMPQHTAHSVSHFIVEGDFDDAVLGIIQGLPQPSPFTSADIEDAIEASHTGRIFDQATYIQFLECLVGKSQAFGYSCEPVPIPLQSEMAHRFLYGVTSLSARSYLAWRNSSDVRVYFDIRPKGSDFDGMTTAYLAGPFTENAAHDAVSSLASALEVAIDLCDASSLVPFKFGESIIEFPHVFEIDRLLEDEDALLFQLAFSGAVNEASAEKSEVWRRIKIACALYRDALAVQPASQIVLFYAALESILVGDYDAKGYSVASRAATLLHPKGGKRAASFEQLKVAVYGARNRAVHGSGMDNDPKLARRCQKIAAGCIRAIVAYHFALKAKGREFNLKRFQMALYVAFELGEDFEDGKDFEELISGFGRFL